MRAGSSTRALVFADSGCVSCLEEGEEDLTSGPVCKRQGGTSRVVGWVAGHLAQAEGVSAEWSVHPETDDRFIALPIKICL